MSTKRAGPERGATDDEIAKIVMLKDRHGLTLKVIGERLGMHPDIVGSHYRKAKAVAA